MDTKSLSRAANEARGLAMDAVHTCQSGHLGLPLGCAEIGAVLFGNSLSYNPAEPKWLNRDRFILSAGHGSMFLYSWLHLSGYPQMTIEEVKHFRASGSRTPGHPEFHETLGVEATTGPLGQGVANAVGYAVSQKMAAGGNRTLQHLGDVPQDFVDNPHRRARRRRLHAGRRRHGGHRLRRAQQAR